MDGRQGRRGGRTAKNELCPGQREQHERKQKHDDSLRTEKRWVYWISGRSKEKVAKHQAADLPGGPVVKNPSCNAEDAGSIPGRGTKIPHTAGQLSPRATNYRAHVLWNPRTTTREKPVHHNKEPTRRNERSHVPQLRPNAAKNNK